ncbi:MAG: NADH-quinone oxidoreductase subunit L [Gemmobacter sp.]
MEIIILFAPLVGALICGFGWRLTGEHAGQVLTTGLVFLAALLSWILFLTFDGETRQIEILRWIESGSFATEWSIRLDRLTAVMLVVVTTVSALVHLYSFGYMAHDENWHEGEHYKARFFAYLSFFTFTMLMLVTADNLVQLFFGWEGVGVASYLLIGFYYRKPSANAAAMKAFIVNRVGDFALILGMAAIFFLTDSIRFDDIFAAAPGLAETEVTFLWTSWNAANLIGVLLFIGAMGKSAQLFLHTWLPDAMEGPTPVSALIHAATMVTAGVFLVSRMSPLYEYAADARTMIVWIGAATAFFAATVGLVQNDIKRVIAYSTCSQLGFMFVAAGVGVYSVAMFHLFTHAFFKAMLFLGAGSVIHAMHHEQDMRNYGGLRKKVPYTFWAMLIGTLAITGVGIPLTHIGFAGFVSKDAIIESAFAGGPTAVFWILVIGACMTSFYSWRLMFMTFWGQPRGDRHTHDHAHESPMVMLIPLGVLAVGAVFAGMIWYGPFFGTTAQVNEWFAGAILMVEENTVLRDAHYVPNWVKVSPFVAMLIGLGLAYQMYIRRPDLPGKLAEAQRPLYLFLLNKWYFDELYDAVFVRPARALGRFLWKRGDGKVIDGALNGIALGIIPFFTRLAGRMQSGYLFHYAFAMVLGVVILVTWMTLAGGSR